MTYWVIGPNDVAVPTYFFKVVTAEKGLTKRRWAYIVPNKPIEGSPLLSNFEVSIDKVEKVSGVIFR